MSAPDITNRALEGVKIANFAQAFSGPIAASILALYGATVVKIETRTHLDWMRQAAPFLDNVQTPDHAVNYICLNSGGQYGITLNFKNQHGREIAERLIKWADVVIENFEITQ